MFEVRMFLGLEKEFVLKTFWVQRYVWVQKNFDSKKFLSNRISWSKKCLVQNKFLVQNNSSKKFGQKIFWYINTLNSYKSGCKEILRLILGRGGGGCWAKKKSSPKMFAEKIQVRKFLLKKNLGLTSGLTWGGVLLVNSFVWYCYLAYQFLAS